MYLKFKGFLTGHGLKAAAVDVDLADEGIGSTVLCYRGRFVWTDSGQFVAGDDYYLELHDGRRWDIQITDVSEGPQPVVKFETI
jgi:hypothetical protein